MNINDIYTIWYYENHMAHYKAILTDWIMNIKKIINQYYHAIKTSHLKYNQFVNVYCLASSEDAIDFLAWLTLLTNRIFSQFNYV